MTAISVSGSPNIPSSSSKLTLANGLNSSGSNQFFNGKIHEVIMFSGELNDHAVRRLEGYLAWKWGGQSNLVNGHPYKASRPQFGGTQTITLAHTNVPVDPATGSIKTAASVEPPRFSAIRSRSIASSAPVFGWPLANR